MSTSTDLARLRWRCRRGMRELDAVMVAYIDNHYVAADADERERFEELLAFQDPELFQLMCGKEKDVRYQSIVDKVKVTLGQPAVDGDNPTVEKI